MLIFNVCPKCKARIYAQVKGQEVATQAKKHIVCPECDAPQNTGRKNRKGEPVITKQTLWHRIVEN